MSRGQIWAPPLLGQALSLLWQCKHSKIQDVDVTWSHALVMQEALVEKSGDFPKASQEEGPTWARR